MRICLLRLGIAGCDNPYVKRAPNFCKDLPDYWFVMIFRVTFVINNKSFMLRCVTTFNKVTIQKSTTRVDCFGKWTPNLQAKTKDIQILDFEICWQRFNKFLTCILSLTFQILCRTLAYSSLILFGSRPTERLLKIWAQLRSLYMAIFFTNKIQRGFFCAQRHCTESGIFLLVLSKLVVNANGIWQQSSVRIRKKTKAVCHGRCFLVLLQGHKWRAQRFPASKYV